MLEVFTTPAVTPEHVLNPACKVCNKCTLCVETGGLTYLEQLQTEAFKAHIWRVSAKKGDAVNYRYRIKYMRDPSALELPDNYQISYQRHRNLRNSFSKLPEEAQLEFTNRLTQGLKQRYWEVVPEQEALQLRQLPGPGVTPGHYLPANFVLKTQGSTRARLVLDPSSSLNQVLLKAPNLEQTIANVMRKIQGAPVLCSQDVREAFFRLSLALESTSSREWIYSQDTGQG